MTRLRIHVLALFALAAILLAGCVQPGPGDSDGNAGAANGLDLNIRQNGIPEETPVVEAGDIVWLQYKAILTDGTIYTSTGTDAAAFKAGAGQMLKCLDTAVIGMATGDEKNLSPEIGDAYGHWQAEKVEVLGLDELAGAGITPEVGMWIEHGGRQGKIVEVDEDAGEVRVDFNHELAGKQVFFWIHVVKIGKMQ